MELRATPLWMSRIEPEGEPAEFALVLQRAIAGDVSAFEQIIVRYERRVLTLAWRLLASAEDAQDASQEVFLRAFRFLHRFDVRRKFEPWLVRMTVNVCRDLGRKRPQHVLLDPEVLTSSSDPHADVQSEERRKILYSALRDLPEKERMAIVLRDIEGVVLHISNMRFVLTVPNPGGGYMPVTIATDVEVPQGQQVVVGKATFVDKAFILVMTAKF